jgi:predicted transglutaminase-like cysteine proteinase
LKEKFRRAACVLKEITASIDTLVVETPVSGVSTMKKKAWFRAALGATAIVGLTSTLMGCVETGSNSIASESSSLKIGGEVDMPTGYFNLCQSTPSACNFEGGGKRGAKMILTRLTPERMRQLQDVTLAVNQSMHAVDDRTQYGETDHWTVGGREGDCEDFAMAKRMRLVANGWPKSSVLVAIVRNWGEQHAVLVARTDRGDFVLDNLTSAVRPWRETGYGWEKIQSPSDFSWRAL